MNSVLRRLSPANLLALNRPPDQALTPAQMNANIRHLVGDIAWFGIVWGSIVAFLQVYVVRLGASSFLVSAITYGPALVAIFLAYLVYGRKPLANPKTADPLAKPLGFLFRWMNKKFMVDELYQAVVLGPYKKLADFFAHPVDQGVIDGLVNGMGTLTVSFAGVLRKLQTGFARTYALSVFVGIILILVYLLTRI